MTLCVCRVVGLTFQYELTASLLQGPLGPLSLTSGLLGYESGNHWVCFRHLASKTLLMLPRIKSAKNLKNKLLEMHKL